jgi:membrane protease YdiL (CAAX protease family)
MSTFDADSESRSNRKQLFRSVAIYYVIACGWAWLAWSPIVLGTEGLKVFPINASLPICSCIATLGPFLGAFIAYRIEYGNWRAVHLFPGSRSRTTWLLLGPLLILLSMFVVFPTLISRGGPDNWHWNASALLGIWVPMFNYNLLGGPLFEEFGWRGFLQARLQRDIAPWFAAICVGFMWAAWHLPLFLVSWSSASPLTYVFIVVCLSTVMVYAFNSSGGSVLVAILMHSAFNSSSQFIGPFLGATPTRERPSGELLIGFSFLIVAAVALAMTRGRLGAIGSK